MVVMALDHANYFVSRQHVGNEFWFIPPPQYATALEFLTRAVTHLAAPGFFFLMGAGMSLFAASRRKIGWREGAIARHLALRGVLLIGLQLAVENRAWPIALPPGATFSFTWYLGVLFGLGGALVLGSVLLRLGSWVLVGLGAGLIGISNLLLSDMAAGEALHPLRALFLTAGSSGDLNVYYPVLPWLGVALLGVVFARVFVLDKRLPLVWASALGAGLLGLFTVLRALGLGDPHRVIGDGWMAFLSLTKYPPSIDFLLVTLGIDLLLLGVLAWMLQGGKVEHVLFHPLIVFGRAPLLFYLLHLFLYAFIGVLVAPQGTGLQAMYPWWIAGLAVLYPICWAYGRFKSSRAPDSLWRFL